MFYLSDGEWTNPSPESPRLKPQDLAPELQSLNLNPDQNLSG